MNPLYTGVDADGVSETELDHFMKCPVCEQGFDMRDLAQVVEHVHDDSEIEVQIGPGPPLVAGPCNEQRPEKRGPARILPRPDAPHPGQLSIP